MLRGIRGAVAVEENSPSSILDAAERLMRAVIDANEIRSELVSAVFFTVTKDLDACFPAEVRTRIGWSAVPFLCGQEIPVHGAMSRVLRVLVLVETECTQEQIRHQYLGETASLRPDLNK